MNTRVPHWTPPPPQTSEVTPSERLQVFDRLHLNVPTIRLVTTLEILQSRRLVLEGVKQPVQDNLAEPSPVLVAECTTVSNIDVAFPCWNSTWDVLVVTLGLSGEVSTRQ